MPNNKDIKKLVARAYSLRTRYGISLDDYDKKFDEQKGVCAVCLKPPVKSLCVDHIHVKGYKKMAPEDKRKYVRGLLCFICNTTIGKLERRKDGCRELLDGIIRYFEMYPLKGEI